MLEFGLTALLILLLLWLWWRGRRADPRGMLWLAGITLLVTHFVSPRTATTHFIVLLLPTFMIFGSWRRQNPPGSRGWVLLTLVLTLVGSWALFLLTVQGNQESAVNYLPLPLALAAALWALRSDWLPRLRGVQ
jgi:4-amino-4-deoxy-L-arabinose transferase-like glycosyltransferase